MKNDIKILAIESSCDETAASVIGVNPSADGGQPIILSNIVSSQVDLHALTGGVVPEVASRAHVEAIVPVIAEALIAAKKVRHSECNEESRDDEILRSAQDDTHVDFQEAIKILQKDIDYIAVTAGPGLIGSLLVGFNSAKTLAFALDKPIIPINHIEGHIYSALANCHSEHSEESRDDEILRGACPELVEWAQDDNTCRFPILALTVSGGHTSLTLMRDHGKYETLGETLDDAAGEAFDKVAKLLDLGYPGGPAVSKLASQFRDNLKFKISNPPDGRAGLKSSPNEKMINEKIIENCKLKIENSPKGLVFPRPILNDGTFNFSFSGLKTAVLQKVLEIKRDIFISRHPEPIRQAQGRLREGSQGFFADAQNDIRDIDLSDEIKQEVSAAFEDAVVDVLITKTMRAADRYKPKAIILAGGVAANKTLRNALELKIVNCKLKIKFYVPDIKLCGDNAAMIGLAAYYHILRGDVSTWKNIEVDSNLEL